MSRGHSETSQQHLQLSEAVPLPLAWRETHWHDDSRSGSFTSRVKQYRNQKIRKRNMKKHMFIKVCMQKLKNKNKRNLHLDLNVCCWQWQHSSLGYCIWVINKTSTTDLVVVIYVPKRESKNSVFAPRIPLEKHHQGKTIQIHQIHTFTCRRNHWLTWETAPGNETNFCAEGSGSAPTSSTWCMGKKGGDEFQRCHLSELDDSLWQRNWDSKKNLEACLHPTSTASGLRIWSACVDQHPFQKTTQLIELVKHQPTYWSW